MVASSAAPTLAIHPGSLGDVLLAIPALRALRAARPGAALELGAQPRIAELLAGLGVVDRALAFEGLGLDALFGDDGGRRVSPDLLAAGHVVSWFGAGDAGYVRRLHVLVPGAVVAPSITEGLPVWKHLLGTVAPMARPDLGSVRVPAPLAEAGRQALVASGWDGRSPVLLVHPGASGPAKRWNPDGFARALGAVRRSGHVPVIHQGPSDAEATERLASRLPAALVLREPTLPVLAGVLAGASAYLGNDSGVSHLAAALGVPSVVLFTPANLRWRPWGTGARPLVVALPGPTTADVSTVTAALTAALRTGVSERRLCRRDRILGEVSEGAVEAPSE